MARGGWQGVGLVALSLVLAIQTMRVFMVTLTGPPIAKLISRYA